MGSSLSGILSDIGEYLTYLRDEGVRTVEVSPDVVAGIDALSVIHASAGEEPEQAAASEPEQEPETAPESAAEATQEGESGDMAEEKTQAPTGVAEQLELVAGQIRECRKCELHETRTKTVPGQGSFLPEIMFVGEAPGHEEDRRGLPFVGRAGQLLTKMIEAMGYTREEVYIANILKCRPPGNRNPFPHEMETCLPYLRAQIEILKPKVIIALGAVALKGLMQTTQGISKLRGTWLSFCGIDLMPTYHPAYLLRNPAAKKDCWEDLQAVLRRLGRPIPEFNKKKQD